MKVRWRPAAEADRDGIIDYIAQDDPVAAIDLGDAIDRRVTALPNQPKLYRVGRVRGAREMVVHPNYIVVYRIVRGAIAMSATARTPPAAIGRLNREIVRILSRTEVREKFFNAGVDAVSSSPGELAAAVKSDLVVLDRLIKDAKIHAE